MSLDGYHERKAIVYHTKNGSRGRCSQQSIVIAHESNRKQVPLIFNGSNVKAKRWTNPANVLAKHPLHYCRLSSVIQPADLVSASLSRLVPTASALAILCLAGAPCAVKIAYQDPSLACFMLATAPDIVRISSPRPLTTPIFNVKGILDRISSSQ